jgi:hypothetical protein
MVGVVLVTRKVPPWGLLAKILAITGVAQVPPQSVLAFIRMFVIRIMRAEPALGPSIGTL